MDWQGDWHQTESIVDAITSLGKYVSMQCSYMGGKQRARLPAGLLLESGNDHSARSVIIT